MVSTAAFVIAHIRPRLGKYEVSTPEYRAGIRRDFRADDSIMGCLSGAGGGRSSIEAICRAKNVANFLTGNGVSAKVLPSVYSARGTFIMFINNTASCFRKETRS
jgi:hypothetical protein